MKENKYIIGCDPYHKLTQEMQECSVYEITSKEDVESGEELIAVYRSKIRRKGFSSLGMLEAERLAKLKEKSK
jgi:hypothetical protein